MSLLMFWLKGSVLLLYSTMSSLIRSLLPEILNFFIDVENYGKTALSAEAVLNVQKSDQSYSSAGSGQCIEPVELIKCGLRRIVRIKFKRVVHPF